MKNTQTAPCPLKDADCPVQAAYTELKAAYDLLEAASRIDALTGFFNYRHLLDALNREMERTRRTGIATAIVMADIDHFKKFNDTHGHDAGNLALQWVARTWREQIRSIDIPCRFGGEEFVIILPGTDLPGAIQVAERLRVELTKAPLKLDDASLPLSTSLGVATYTQKLEWPCVEAFIKAADQYLYQAKENGRNQTCYDQSKLTPPATGVTSEERDVLFSL